MCSVAGYFPNSRANEDCDQTRKIAGGSVANDNIDLVGSSATDEDLVHLLGQGSGNALTLLFHRYHRKVSNVALRILKDVSEAQDLCQEVFLVIFQRARLFDSSKGTASSWIIQIAYHRSINRKQYLTHRQHYISQEPNERQIADGQQSILVNEIAAKDLLMRLRAQLSHEQMETLELHFFEGYTLREIAEETNQTLGNVRHHYYRGLERLRSMISSATDR